jgi:hypothetical protein
MNKLQRQDLGGQFEITRAVVNVLRCVYDRHVSFWGIGWINDLFHYISSFQMVNTSFYFIGLIDRVGGGNIREFFPVVPQSLQIWLAFVICFQKKSTMMSDSVQQVKKSFSNTWLWFSGQSWSHDDDHLNCIGVRRPLLAPFFLRPSTPSNTYWDARQLEISK